MYRSSEPTKPASAAVSCPTHIGHNYAMPTGPKHPGHADGAKTFSPCRQGLNIPAMPTYQHKLATEGHVFALNKEWRVTDLHDCCHQIHTACVCEVAVVTITAWLYLLLSHAAWLGMVSPHVCRLTVCTCMTSLHAHVWPRCMHICCMQANAPRC